MILLLFFTGSRNFGSIAVEMVSAIYRVWWKVFSLTARWPCFQTTCEKEKKDDYKFECGYYTLEWIACCNLINELVSFESEECNRRNSILGRHFVLTRFVCVCVGWLRVHAEIFQSCTPSLIAFHRASITHRLDFRHSFRLCRHVWFHLVGVFFWNIIEIFSFLHFRMLNCWCDGCLGKHRQKVSCSLNRGKRVSAAVPP